MMTLNIDFREEAGKMRDVFRRPSYLIIVLVVAAAAFTFYALLLNYKLLISTAATGNMALLAKLSYDLLVGYPDTVHPTALILSGAIALGIGMNMALVLFRTRELRSFDSASVGSLGGFLVAIVAPACPACATTAFAAAGFSSVLGFLPFGGTELKVLSILLLLGSAVWVTTKIHKESCEI